MKKLVLTSSTIFMVSICLLFACTMNEDVEVKKPQVENLMMPKEYAEIGESTTKDWRQPSMNSESTTKYKNVPAKPPGFSAKTNAFP